VLRGSQGICEQFPGDPWFYFCNDDFEFFSFLIKGIMFVKNNGGTSLFGGMLYLAVCFIWRYALFRMTVRISN
jgi:hypothetical protein